MKTSANYLPTLPAPVRTGALLIAPLAKLYQERARMREFAFAAAVRLSDQDKPIALKLLVELAIVLRVVTLWVRASRSATKTAHSQPRKRAAVQIAVRQVQIEKRSAAVNTRRDRRQLAGNEAARLQGVRNRRMAGRCASHQAVAHKDMQQISLCTTAVLPGSIRSGSRVTRAPLSAHLC